MITKEARKQMNTILLREKYDCLERLGRQSFSEIDESESGEIEFSSPNYFHLSCLYRNEEDPQDIRLEFGTGTLSPLQNAALLLYRAAKASGGYVKLLSKFHYCPALIGEDNSVIPLYELVELIDGIIDYNRIRNEYPSLSYSQIHGALEFLRKVAQFNTSNLDLDEAQDDESAQDAAFIEELRKALSDGEVSRVLNFNDCNR